MAVEALQDEDLEIAMLIECGLNQDRTIRQWRVSPVGLSR
jgi:hypothetical protein